MKRRALLRWLAESDPERLRRLRARACAARGLALGTAVRRRGLIEVSNICQRRCLYCGLRAPNREVSRYRMSADQVIACARRALQLGCGRVVLQAGEDHRVPAGWFAELITRIIAEVGVAVTLSLGEHPTESYALWRRAGADRYLLRFETSDEALYRRLHPPRRGGEDRLVHLRRLADLGYGVGSGVIVGLPGQTRASLARDLELFVELGLMMIALGPFIPHPDTPLGRAPLRADQISAAARETTTLIALSRLLIPEAHIPVTTALRLRSGEVDLERGFEAGADVVMLNVTPPELRERYQIYPGKGGIPLPSFG